MTKYNFKRTDTRPKVEYTPTENNRRVSLSGSATCTFVMAADDDGQLIVNSSGTVESTDPLTLSYAFSEDETAETGDYSAEFRVDYGDGGDRTFPDDGYIPISIHKEIDVGGSVTTGDVRPDVTVGTMDALVTDTGELSVGDYPGSIGLDADSSPTEYVGQRVTVAGSSYHTIFSVSTPVDVIGGHVIGSHVRQLRVAWGDGTGTVFSGGVSQGAATDGSYISHAPIPTLTDVSKLEFRNGDGGSVDYGYKVLTR
jgi:hypothetical protein